MPIAWQTAILIENPWYPVSVQLFIFETKPSILLWLL